MEQLRAAEKPPQQIKRIHGKDFYHRIGAKGGRNGHTGGFASMTHEQVSAAGRKGGLKSRRGPAKKEMSW